MTIDALQTIAWSAFIVAAIYPLEYLFPAEPSQPISGRICNLLYMPLITFFIYMTQPILNVIAAHILNLSSGLPKPNILPTTAFSTILLSLIFALVWDVWQYWVHRLQHTSALFWPTHEFHHSETALNASTHARTHVGSHVLFVMLWLPLVALLGTIAPHWVAAFLMFRLWGYFIHANIKLHLGWFTPVVSGPQWHRIHHSARPEHFNKNFATLFPFIDIVFGTYYAPSRNEFPETGLGRIEHVSFLEEASVQPFRRWHDMSRATFQQE
jgi:sterol desaturase/sphingolipid hydroxylase (fatty acid hydroxylase superfamily)